MLQGCAGSGKTMIMLHRLSFLMYNNESLQPSDVLVLTPSDSFNAFIDELSQVLELEKIKTTTIDEYFLQLLQNEGVDIAGKIDFSAGPPRRISAISIRKNSTRTRRAGCAKFTTASAACF